MSCTRCDVGILGLSFSDSSIDNFSVTTLSASSMGTCVNRFDMSKLISRSSGCSCVVRMMSTKDAEFFTACGVFPVNGVRILASSLASLYVGEPIVDTMGLIGVPFLCILGRPYIWGGEE